MGSRSEVREGERRDVVSGVYEEKDVVSGVYEEKEGDVSSWFVYRCRHCLFIDVGIVVEDMSVMNKWCVVCRVSCVVCRVLCTCGSNEST